MSFTVPTQKDQSKMLSLCNQKNANQDLKKVLKEQGERLKVPESRPRKPIVCIDVKIPLTKTIERINVYPNDNS